MHFISLGWLVALALIVHCYKTGRDRWWMWALLVMGPLASVAYLILELIPEYLSSYGGKKATKKLKRAINPNAEVKRLTDDMLRSESVDTRRRLAEELLEREDYAEAERLYRKSRYGMFEHDPVMMLGQAQALFGLKRYEETVATLDELIEKNPDFRNQDGHLLYARALGELGNDARAIEEYDAVIEYYSGPQAHIRYAGFLESQGHSDKARKMYQKVLEVARLSPAHYRRTHKQWIKIAKQNV